MSNWKDLLAQPTHPIWPILRTLLATVAAGIVLASTATSFDATEAKAVGGIGGSVAVIELLKRQLTKG